VPQTAKIVLQAASSTPRDAPVDNDERHRLRRATSTSTSDIDFDERHRLRRATSTSTSDIDFDERHRRTTAAVSLQTDGQASLDFVPTTGCMPKPEADFEPRSRPARGGSLELAPTTGCMPKPEADFEPRSRPARARASSASSSTTGANETERREGFGMQT
jgi:hypothetical protein